MIYLSMGLEVGFALDPRDIADLVCIYIRAVECLRHDPRFADGGGDIVDLWLEFRDAGHG